MVQAENETSLAQNQINKSYGEQKTPAFSIFNMKGSYTFQLSGKALDISLGITNLFNRAYYEHLDWGRIYRPGRSLEMYVKYNF